MACLHRILAIAALALSLAALATPAPAAGIVRYISHTINSGVDCRSPDEACTLIQALGEADPGDIIKCVDEGHHLGATITKSIKIDCSGAVAFFGDLIIDGANLEVVLRGLTIDGYANGIEIAPGTTGSVSVEDCVIRYHTRTNPSGSGNGIRLRNAAGIVELSVLNTHFVGNIRVGIAIEPTSGGSAQVTVDGSTMIDANGGIRADTANTAGWINVAVVNTLVSGNSLRGININAGPGAIKASIDGSTIVNNNQAGLRVTGANATVLLRDTTITNNATGIEVLGGPRLFSYGNNAIDGNGNNGPNPTIIARK